MRGRRGHGVGMFGGRGPGGRAPDSLVLVGGAVVLLALGLLEALHVGMVFHRGAHEMGIIVRVDRDRDDTRIRVAGAECPVTGDVGRVGNAVAVVFPHGHPIDCIVASPRAFRWSAGAILLGGAILAGAIYRMKNRE